LDKSHRDFCRSISKTYVNPSFSNIFDIKISLRNWQ
jgi:hypothetical protein